MTPILPENRDRYPDDWPEIRERIRRRATGPDGVTRCEWCGVPNGAHGWRDEDGRFHQVSPDRRTWSWLNRVRHKRGRHFKIVCTTAHLNHDPRDCRDENLALLCQQCHNRYDAPVRAARRRERLLDRMGQTRLFV